MGLFDHWPNGLGFDYFYGFIAALTDQFSPQLVENCNPDRSSRRRTILRITWIGTSPITSFTGFGFSATCIRTAVLRLPRPGTVHSPHQAPAESNT